MDYVGHTKGYMQRQMALEGGREDEVVLEITVPICALEDVYRVGWSIKGCRSGRWIALTTGKATHDVREPVDGARWIAMLIDECGRLTRGDYYDRRD